MLAEARQHAVTYTEALSRGGVLLAEMRALLRVWRPGEATQDLIRRVRDEDVLGKSTARTVNDYVRAFSRRFLTPTDEPARHLSRVADDTAPRDLFRDLLFYYIARKDDLLRDFTVLRYWPMAREGRLSLSTYDAKEFLWEAEQDGRIARPWSAAVKKDMPARLLNALADFGLLGKTRAPRHPILPYRPTDGAVTYLAHLLHRDGVTDASLAEHPAWALFGLAPIDVWHRLDSLAGDGWFVIQRAGQVVRITWNYSSVEEVLDALARR
jgi:hypothetical protein